MELVALSSTPRVNDSATSWDVGVAKPSQRGPCWEVCVFNGLIEVVTMSLARCGKASHLSG